MDDQELDEHIHAAVYKAEERLNDALKFSNRSDAPALARLWIDYLAVLAKLKGPGDEALVAAAVEAIKKQYDA